MSCLGDPIIWDFKNYQGGRRKVVLILIVVSIILCGLQLVYYTKSNIYSYIDTINREEKSSSIAFYRKLDETYLSKLPHNIRLMIYRDPIIYVPPLPNFAVGSRNTGATYSFIDCLNPDLILLWKSNIERYADPSVIGISLNKTLARRKHEFYFDVKSDSLKGYHRVVETEFGVAFARDK